MALETEYLLKTLTIDPGEQTGWAYWNGGEVPEEVGKFSAAMPKPGKALEYRTEQMREEFRSLIVKLDGLNHVYVEGVDSLDSDTTNITAVKRVNLMKLSCRIEVYCKICKELSIDFTMISANRWKGHMGNDEVSLRVYRSIQKHYSQPHVTNSVGIGLSIMGKL